MIIKPFINRNTPINLDISEISQIIFFLNYNKYFLPTRIEIQNIFIICIHYNLKIHNSINSNDLYNFSIT
jgi:hypothetical protein